MDKKLLSGNKRHNTKSAEQGSPRPDGNSKKGLLSDDPKDFRFIGEQVSHHPPITAIYADCPLGDISIEGSVGIEVHADMKWMSLTPFKGVKAEHVGSIVFKDQRHGEDYKVTFPDAYASNVFEVPELNFQGKATIECSNGHSATINYVKKGGKDRFSITGSMDTPSSQKAMSFSGKWNGKVVKDSTNEVVFDAKQCHDAEKLCPPVYSQEHLESRRLWRHVTRALVENDEEEANQEKEKIEQWQRDHRKELGASYFVRKGPLDWKFKGNSGS